MRIVDGNIAAETLCKDDNIFYLTGNKREKCNFYEIMDGKKVCPQGSEGMSSEQAIVVGGFVWFGLLG